MGKATQGWAPAGQAGGEWGGTFKEKDAEWYFDGYVNEPRVLKKAIAWPGQQGVQNLPGLVDEEEEPLEVANCGVAEI